MKKQMKIAAVVSATALLAIGASFTSMAATKTYDWRFDDNGEYVCYNANGVMYTEAWVESGAYKYYVDEDGHYLRNTWVEGEEDDLYYVREDGSMVTNGWKELVALDADEDEDASWYYFGSNGKMVTKKKIDWNDGTYYVDEDGKMLTGWVEYSKTEAGTVCEQADGDTKVGRLFYCDESGKRLEATWLNDFGPAVTEEEAEDLDESDMKYYYIKSNGGIQTGRNKDINGETYYFDSTNGQMLSGWVHKVDTNKYEAYSGDLTGKYKTVFFCGDADEGWMKKNRWVKTYSPEDYADADADLDSTYWYWINKDGYVFIPTAEKATDANTMKFVNGSASENVFTVKATKAAQELEINKKTYLFGTDGKMLTGLVKLGKAQDMFYYGSDGAKKTGVQNISDAEGDSYEFSFATTTKYGETLGAAITGVENKKLYKDGLLQTAENDDVYKVVEVNDKEYIVNENGRVQTSTKTTYEFENKKGEWKATFAGKTREAKYVAEWIEVE